MADTTAVEHEPQAQLKQPVAPAAPAQIVRPDGGYGWIVVMASFVAHFVCLGEMYKQQQQSWLCLWPSISPHALPPSLPPSLGSYSFGVLFVALLDDDSLDGNRSSTAWIGSLVVGIMLFTCTCEHATSCDSHSALTTTIAAPRETKPQIQRSLWAT